MYVQNEKQRKTFLIFKNGTKTRNCKSLFKQILSWEKKPAKNDHICLVAVL